MKEKTTRKIYGYFIVKKNFNDDNGLVNVSLEVEVEDKGEEFAFVKKAENDKYFFSPWGDYFYKRDLGKVYSYPRYGILYGVYLEEDNKEEAIRILRESCNKDIEDLESQILKQKEVLENISIEKEFKELNG